jgi:hypothetical protein
MDELVAGIGWLFGARLGFGDVEKLAFESLDVLIFEYVFTLFEILTYHLRVQ